MLRYTRNVINRLNSILIGPEFSICVLLSKKGYGKSTIAKEFMRSSEYKYTILHSAPAHYNHLYPLSIALHINTTDYHCLYTHAVDFLNAHNKSAFIFDDSESYQEELVRIITEISEFCTNNTIAKTSIVFLFIINNTQSSILLDEYFSKFNKYVSYISLPKWEVEELNELFDLEYPTCDYSEKDLNQIISLSFSNPGDFISNLEELKRKGNFERTGENSRWILHDVSPDILSPKTARIVQERFEQLNDSLKDTIQKASIIGKEFDSQTLENPLRVARAHQLLMQIEDISQLIYRKLPDHSLYCFENDEAYLSIDGIVKESDRIVWNNAIARFFAQEIKNKYTALEEHRIDEYLRKAAYYFKKAGNYQTAGTFQLKLISRCMAFGNYSQVICLIKELENYPENCLTDEIRKAIYVYIMDSYEVLFDFPNALVECNKFIQYCNIKPDKLSWGIIKKAYYYYYTNDTPKAYNLIRFITEGKDPYIDKNAKLYVDGYNLLSAIGETLGHQEYIEHYHYAVSSAKKFGLEDSYYSLLRKANAVYKSNRGIEMMYKAYQYFSDKNKYLHAMTAHNIGTQFALMLNKNASLRYLKEAERLFREIGSAGLMPTLNSIAVYYLLLERDYTKALEILQKLNSFDEFETLAVLNNIATCKRKLEAWDEAKIWIDKIAELNNKPNNHFRWYEECLILQRAYLCKAQGLYEKSLEHFRHYIDQGYGIVKGNKVSVIKNIIYLSKLLGLTLPQNVEIMKNARDESGQYFYDNDLMIADLFFWE